MYKVLKKRCGWSESASVLLLFIEKDWISESEAKGMMQISSVGIFAFASTVERGTVLSSTQRHLWVVNRFVLRFSSVRCAGPTSVCRSSIIAWRNHITDNLNFYHLFCFILLVDTIFFYSILCSRVYPLIETCHCSSFFNKS